MDPQTANPKAQPIVGVVLTVLAAFLIVGVVTFAEPCAVQEGREPASCLWASRAVLGVGAVIAILAIVRIFETNEGERRGLSLACALLGFLCAVIPGPIIALCADPALPCNTAMRPFVVCVGVAIGFVGAIDLTRRLLALKKR